MISSCPKCGRRYKNHDPKPKEIKCCGLSLVLEPGLPNCQPCIHRGVYKGEASCGCGAIYLCTLLQFDGNPLYCGDNVPIDEYVDVGGTMLTKNNYRACPDCGSRASTPQVRIAQVDSKQ